MSDHWGGKLDADPAHYGRNRAFSFIVKSTRQQELGQTSVTLTLNPTWPLRVSAKVKAVNDSVC